MLYKVSAIVESCEDDDFEICPIGIVTASSESEAKEKVSLRYPDGSMPAKKLRVESADGCQSEKARMKFEKRFQYFDLTKKEDNFYKDPEIQKLWAVYYQALSDFKIVFNELKDVK